MKIKTVYECSACHAITPAWSGKCATCGAWGSIEETIQHPKDKSSGAKRVLNSAKKLQDVEITNSHRLVSGLSEFNRVVGGGIIEDSVTILTAAPGVGKSTLLLELAEDYSSKNHRVLYISGEESESQIKARAGRIMKKINDKIWIVSTNSMDVAIASIEQVDPAIIFFDSIQTLTLEEVTSRAGSPLQTMECANALVEIAKNGSKPRAVIMIGHMNKSDEMAGLRTLEHLVDTVLVLQNDLDYDLRLLVATKNRFGPIGEPGLFRMSDEGMKEVTDADHLFVSKREHPVAGSSKTIIKEGSRYIPVEIESLVSNAPGDFPIRIGDSLNKNQLNTLISIIEERAGIRFSDKSVVLKATGGIGLKEQAVNLAVIMSMISSRLNCPIAEDVAFISEVGLTGELKPVTHLEQRIKELFRHGYRKIYVPQTAKISIKSTSQRKIRAMSHLNEVVAEIFRETP